MFHSNDHWWFSKFIENHELPKESDSIALIEAYLVNVDYTEEEAIELEELIHDAMESILARYFGKTVGE